MCMCMYLLFNAYSNCSQKFFRFHHSTKQAKPIVKRPKENIQNHFISLSFIRIFATIYVAHYIEIYSNRLYAIQSAVANECIDESI